MRLRDMGLKPKALIKACEEAGLRMSSKRASEIINGQSFIHADEMEIIAILLKKSVDDLYIDLGSVMEVICPLLSAGRDKQFLCCRQKCAWWDWQMQWCTIKSINTMKIP